MTSYDLSLSGKDIHRAADFTLIRLYEYARQLHDLPHHHPGRSQATRALTLIGRELGRRHIQVSR